MPSLKGTQTEQNLKHAFAGKSPVNRRSARFGPKGPYEQFEESWNAIGGKHGHKD